MNVDQSVAPAKRSQCVELIWNACVFMFEVCGWEWGLPHRLVHCRHPPSWGRKRLPPPPPPPAKHFGCRPSDLQVTYGLAPFTATAA